MCVLVCVHSDSQFPFFKSSLHLGDYWPTKTTTVVSNSYSGNAFESVCLWELCAHTHTCGVACTYLRADVTLQCLLAQVHAATESTALMVPDQEARRERRAPDEREAEDL